MVVKRKSDIDEDSAILQHYIEEFEYRHCEGNCDCNQSQECPWTSIILKGN